MLAEETSSTPRNQVTTGDNLPLQAYARGSPGRKTPPKETAA